jgi:diadenosine tetraphosphate (Ap4A) HIT family hydrolase
METLANTRMTARGCDFCNEFSGSPENAFQRIYGGDQFSRTLLRTEELAVVPSLGQIVEGYLLILPRVHFKAVGDLPANALNKFASISRQVGRVVEKEYGSFILFEHGTRSEGMGGCGIYHAHIHMVPIARTADPITLLKSSFLHREFDDLEQLKTRSEGLLSYLLFQDSDKRLYVFDTGPLPSQFMRKLLADALGVREWDWRAYGREERLIATMKRLSVQFDAISMPTVETNVF